MRQQLAVCVLAAFPSVAAARSTNVPPPVDWLKELTDQETLASVHLTDAEQQQVLARVQTSSFDTPDSWTDELRVRRISLGRTEGLVIRGTRLLCGGTGNCETWLFRRSNHQWLNMFEGEAPVVAGIGFVKQTKEVRDVVVTAHVSADAATWTRYAFDGRSYREVSRGSD